MAKPRRVLLREQAQAVGPEQLDKTPLEVPLEHLRPPTIKEELQRYVRYEISQIGKDAGFSSFEEEDDFDIEDEEVDLLSPYQMTELQEEAGFEGGLDGAPSEPAPRGADDSERRSDNPPKGPAGSSESQPAEPVPE